MKALFEQTVVDITLEKFGSLDFLGKVIQDNNLNILDDLTNREIIVNNSGFGDERTKKYLSAFHCVNNSSVTSDGLFIKTESGLYILTESGEKIKIG